METIPNNKDVIDSSLKGLQSRKETLLSKRRRLQGIYYLLGVTAVLLPIAGYLVTQGLGCPKTITYTLWFIPIMNFLIPFCFFLIVRQRLRLVENEIQELEFQIDLQQFAVNIRETRAEKLLRINDFQLRRYYDLNISQNSWVFALGMFCIILGVALVSITLFLVIGQANDWATQVITAVLGSIGAILSNFVAVIYLKMNSAATDNLKVFHSRLVETHQFLLGNLLASRIEGEQKREETLSQLSLCLMQKGKD
jgi:hypothetical protein